MEILVDFSFFFFFRRETTFVQSCLLSCTPCPFQRSLLEGKNLLHMGQILSFQSWPLSIRAIAFWTEWLPLQVYPFTQLHGEMVPTNLTAFMHVLILKNNLLMTSHCFWDTEDIQIFGLKWVLFQHMKCKKCILHEWWIWFSFHIKQIH